MKAERATAFEAGEKVVCVQGGQFPTSPKVGQTYTVAQAGEYTMRLEEVESWVYCSRFARFTDPDLLNSPPKQRLVIHTEVRREMWSEHDKCWVVQQTASTQKTEDIR